MSFLDRNIFQPPYRLMPWVAVVVLVGSFLADPHSSLTTGVLNDPDDYMRLNQVLNWLSGQSWFDTGQPRISPDAHAFIPWSRLVDVPIAVMILLLQQIMRWAGGSVPLQEVALWAAYIVPLLYIPLLTLLTAAAARPLLGRSRANLAPLLLILFWGIVFNVSPGRVDHHIHGLLVAMTGLYAVPRILFCAGGWRAALWAGAAFAIGLQICTEIVPFLLLCWGALGLGVAWRGKIALRNAAVFTLATAIATAILIPTTLPRAAWGHLTISWFSPAFLLLTALVAACFAGVWGYGTWSQNFTSSRSWAAIACRGAVLAAAGLGAMLVFVGAVPSALHGAYADYDSFSATRLIANISETKPILNDLKIIPYNDLSRLRSISVLLERVVPLALIALYGWVMVACMPARRRSLWLLLAVTVTFFLAYSIVGMVRVQRFADLAAVLILAHAVFALWDRLAARRPPWEHVLGGAGVLLLVMLLPHMSAKLIARRVDGPVQADHNQIQCNHQGLMRALMADEPPHTILATYDEAPEILFYTPHRVVGANYNVAGNRDVYDFFNARDDAAARAILHRWGADRVLTCRNFPPFLADREHIKFGLNSFLVQEADGKLHIRSNPQNPALIDRLARGDVPSWLTPIPVADSPDYLLYKVVE